MDYLKLKIFEFLALRFYRLDRYFEKLDDWAKSRASKELFNGKKEIGFYDHLALVFYKTHRFAQSLERLTNKKANRYLRVIKKTIT